MKIIENLEQGSPEWLQMRLSHVTATDASCIIGTNPFKSVLELWEEKLGLRAPEPLNDRMKRGQELEPKARELLNVRCKINFTPYVVVSDEYIFAMASLDGMSEDRRFLCEIKCPSRDTHELAIQGDVRPYYYTQMQHQLLCTGAELCYYCSYYPGHKEELVVLEINPNAEYIEKMLEKEKTFYFDYLCKMIPPPAF